MTVVSNTSPITNLAAIGHLHLLHDIYGRIYIPRGVWDELNAFGRAWPGRNEVAAADWIVQRIVQDERVVAILERDLDRGEAETIALALEMRANLVLLDEREGRHMPQRLGLEVTGAVGTLLAAKSGGLIAAGQPLLDDLRYKAGFYLSDSLYTRALQIAREE